MGFVKFVRLVSALSFMTVVLVGQVNLSVASSVGNVVRVVSAVENVVDTMGSTVTHGGVGVAGYVVD